MIKPDQKDDLYLLDLIASGDQNAFRQIFEAYSGKVYGFALKLTHSRPLSEEIVQDVFMKIWINRESLEAIRSLPAYLFTLTRNHSFNILKRIAIEEAAKLTLSKKLSGINHETEETIIFHESEQLLNQAISKLPPQQRLVYSMCQQEGLKYEEVAQRLKISRLTVKTHMQQALRSIKLHFSGLVSFLILLNF
jgi:RNA polymerase sigma-70 factor (ECF subfamily)